MANISSIQGTLDPRLTGQTRAQSAPQPERAGSIQVREVSPSVSALSPAFDLSELEAATAELRSHLEALNQGHTVGIRNDPGTSTSIIEIHDREGNLVRQFPPEKLLNLRAKLDDLSGMVIDRMT